MSTDLISLSKKIKFIDKKCVELGDITDHLHDSTDKLERLYERDISKRKSVFHGPGETDDSIIDLAEVERIFDAIEAEERRSIIRILFYPHNLLLIGVVAFCGYILTQVTKLGSKSRFD
jgi:hypothetical protein